MLPGKKGISLNKEQADRLIAHKLDFNNALDAHTNISIDLGNR